MSKLGLSKADQLSVGRIKPKKEPQFGKNPSRWQFGKKPSSGSFGKKPYKPQNKQKTTKHNPTPTPTQKSPKMKLQALVNQYTKRLYIQKHGMKCCSCGKHTDYLEAGHYIAISSSSFLRFTFDNINGQCWECNNTLRGNPIRYREWMIKEYGLARVEELEAQIKVSEYRNGRWYSVMIKLVKRKLKKLDNHI